MMDYLLEPQVNLLFQNNFQLRLDRIFQLKHVSVYVEEEIVLPQFQSCICLLCDINILLSSFLGKLSSLCSIEVSQSIYCKNMLLSH